MMKYLDWFNRIISNRIPLEMQLDMGTLYPHINDDKSVSIIQSDTEKELFVINKLDEYPYYQIPARSFDKDITLDQMGIIGEFAHSLSNVNLTRDDYLQRVGISVDGLDYELEGRWNELKHPKYINEEDIYEESDVPCIYFDMDGTVNEFNKDATMEEVFSEGYFRNRPPIDAYIKLAEALQKNSRDDEGNKLYEVCILSKSPFSAIQDKIEWIHEYMPFINDNNITFVPLEANKEDFVKARDFDILIDDYWKNLESWVGIKIQAMNGINNYHFDLVDEVIHTGDIENALNIIQSNIRPTEYVEDNDDVELGA